MPRFWRRRAAWLVAHARSIFFATKLFMSFGVHAGNAAGFGEVLHPLLGAQMNGSAA